jgi:hypothetical protein
MLASATRIIYSHGIPNLALDMPGQLNLANSFPAISPCQYVIAAGTIALAFVTLWIGSLQSLSSLR